MRKQADLLDHISNAPSKFNRIPLANRTAVHTKLAGTWGQELVDQLQSGGFAGTAASQQNKGFTTKHFEIEVVEQFAAVIEQVGDVAKLDRELGRHPRILAAHLKMCKES